MKEIKIIVGLVCVLLLSGITRQSECAASGGYDSTYAIAINQKYSIPENINDGDIVGRWLKCYDYRSGNKITYTIENNLDDCFSITTIDNDSARIIINDASDINGKIIQQDTVIYLVIRSTDSVLGYELDTAIIYVKENSYCTFIDYDYSGTESGTRSQPYSDWDHVPEVNAGHGYYIKRGNYISGEYLNLPRTVGTKFNPTIIGAYGSGGNPVFDGSSLSGENQLFCFNDDYAGGANGNGWQFLYLFDHSIISYPGNGMYIDGTSKNIGIYNCYFADNINENKDRGFADIYMRKSLNDYSNSNNELINCVSNQTWGPLLKLEVSGVHCLNTRIVGITLPTTQQHTGLRIGTSKNVVDHFYITADKQAISFRYDSCVVKNGVIEGGTNAILQNLSETNGIDSLVIQNVLFRNNIYAIYEYQNLYSATTDNYFLDCWFHSNETAIYQRGGIDYGCKDYYVQRCIFSENDLDIDINYSDDGGTDDWHIDYNIFYSSNSMDTRIDIDEGTDIDLHNNVIVGTADLTGVTSGIQKANYFKDLVNGITSDKNLDIDTINTSLHFNDYDNHDFHLKSSAKSAISKGYYWGQVNDFEGNLKYGDEWDIGAFEYHDAEQPLESNIAPEVEDQNFTIDELNNDNFIGTIEATDNDSEQILTFTIFSGNDEGYFEINEETGDLFIVNSDIFNLEPSEYQIFIRVTDNGDGPLSDDAQISIILNKNPIVYIDPDNINDTKENGSEENPYDSWQDVEWVEGYTYVQKRGTIANEDNISIYANNIILGAYGEGNDPIIYSGSGDYAIKLFEKSDISLKNIHVIAEKAISCLYFLGDSNDNILIENSKFEGSIYGIRIVGGQNYTIKYNSFRGNSEAIYSYAKQTKVYYNIFENNQYAVHVEGTGSKSEIYNNVFYDNNTSISTDYSQLTIHNNIFYLVKATDIAIKHNGTQLISDYNIYYPDNEGIITYNSDKFYSLAEFQEIEGIDVNSFTSDPLFVDIFNHDFSLNPESRGIDAGIFVGISSDFIGEVVPFGNGPDLGVIESKTIAQPTFSTQNENEKRINVFPNPTSGIVNITLDEISNEDAELNIQDLNGRTILNRLYSGTGSNFDQTINISNLPEGIYILTLKIASAIHSKRILKVY